MPKPSSADVRSGGQFSHSETEGKPSEVTSPPAWPHFDERRTGMEYGKLGEPKLSGQQVGQPGQPSERIHFCGELLVAATADNLKSRLASGNRARDRRSCSTRKAYTNSLSGAMRCSRPGHPLRG